MTGLPRSVITGWPCGRRVVRVALYAIAVIEWGVGRVCVPARHSRARYLDRSESADKKVSPPIVAVKTAQTLVSLSANECNFLQRGRAIRKAARTRVVPRWKAGADERSVFGSAIVRGWCRSKRAADEVSPTIAARMRKDRIKDVPEVQIKKPRSDRSA
jgi:hypothetical protein